MYISSVEYTSAVELIEKTVDNKDLVSPRFRPTDFEKTLRTVDSPAKKALKVLIVE